MVLCCNMFWSCFFNVLVAQGLGYCPGSGLVLNAMDNLLEQYGWRTIDIERVEYLLSNRATIKQNIEVCG